MGAPRRLDGEGKPSLNELQEETTVAFADMDSSPTKAWLVAHRDAPEWRWHFERAFGKRPAEELYDLKTDPQQLQNLAGDPKHAATRERMAADLLARLSEAGDPRVKEPVAFEASPFTDVTPKGVKDGPSR